MNRNGSRGRALELVAGVVIPLLVLGFVVADRFGLSDWIFGHDSVLNVAARFETSYAKDVDRQVGSDEPAWFPLLDLIRRYSPADLPHDLEPTVFARFQAVSSGMLEMPEGEVAEWTSPATPIVLIYEVWPGQKVAKDQYRVVGSIGDLRTWVARSRADFRFLIQDIAFALLSILVGILIWRRR